MDDVYADAEDEIMTITSSEGTDQALAEAVAAMEDPDSEGASQHRWAPAQTRWLLICSLTVSQHLLAVTQLKALFALIKLRAAS